MGPSVLQCSGVFILPNTEIDPQTNKNGSYRIVWRRSYCTQTDTNTDCHWVRCYFYRPQRSWGKVIFTARKRSLGQGNMLTGVCLSTGGCMVLGRGVNGPGGAWSRRCMVGGDAWSRGGAWSRGVGVHGGDPPQQLLLLVVRILLECILVSQACVILFTGGVPGLGGVCLVWGVHGPRGVCAWSGGAWSQGGLVWGGLVPGGCLVPGVSGPGGVLLETPQTATTAGGTHPTGMHSCIGICVSVTLYVLMSGSVDAQLVYNIPNVAQGQ